jgi:hypothetical protein
MLGKSARDKSRAMASAIVSTLLTLTLAGTLFVSLAKANFLIPPQPDLAVKIQLPESKVYGENSIPVAFNIQRSYRIDQEGGYHGTWYMTGQPDEYRCFLNEKEMVLKVSGVSADSDFFWCEDSLSGLSEGSHRLRIYVHYTYTVKAGSQTITQRNDGYSNSVVFTVNTGAPHVSIVSIGQLKTYNTTSLPLEFTVSEPVTSLSYSLDGEAIVPIAGNTTLSGLSEGTHTIVVEAEDTAGSVGSSAPVKFTVATQTSGVQVGSESFAFPTALVAVIVIASAAVVSFGLVAYFLLRKKRRLA